MTLWHATRGMQYCALQARYVGWIKLHTKDNGVAHATIHQGFIGTLGQDFFGPDWSSDPTKGNYVAQLNLSTVLAGFAIVDHVDMDIEGGELHLWTDGLAALSAKVRTAFIQTQSTEIENAIIASMKANAWEILQYAPMEGVCGEPWGQRSAGDGRAATDLRVNNRHDRHDQCFYSTPFGPVKFMDGQIWARNVALTGQPLR